MRDTPHDLVGETWLCRCVLCNVLNSDIIVSEFECQSCYYVQFQTLGKVTIPLFYSYLALKDWYAIKQRNQTKPN